MKNSEKIKLVGIKQDLARLPRFNNICAVCHCLAHKRGMTFHHLWYLKGEKTYKDFDTPLAYYEYLSPLIRHEPKRFAYLCNPHHQAVTRLARFGPLTRHRLIKIVRKTR